MDTRIKTRFAPSPTGLMHFGNLRTALFNYLYAHHQGGQFLLRIEDTDQERSAPAYTEALLEDLAWCGLNVQEGPYYQSQRAPLYADYFEQLLKRDQAYLCFCSEEQLAIQRKVQVAAKQPPRYAGTCANLGAEQIAQRLAQGQKPVLRFKVARGLSVEFVDLIKGPQSFQSDHIGDFIIRRADQSASFIFCNAIDDALMGITHALRGDDHLSNTPRQLLILEALNLRIPCYGHFPTILGPDGRPLSKRNGSRSLAELRKEGYGSLGIMNYLARLGHYDPNQSLLDLQALSQHFDLTHISHAPAHYNEAQLHYWQKMSMQAQTSEACWQQLAAWVNDEVPADHREVFVALIQPNIMLPADALPFAKALFSSDDLIYSGSAAQLIQSADRAVFTEAHALLKNDPTLSIADCVAKLQLQYSLKAKELYALLRAALTGLSVGPALQPMINLLGPTAVLKRLSAAAMQAVHANL